MALPLRPSVRPPGPWGVLLRTCSGTIFRPSAPGHRPAFGSTSPLVGTGASRTCRHVAKTLPSMRFLPPSMFGCRAASTIADPIPRGRPILGHIAGPASTSSARPGFFRPPRASSRHLPDLFHSDHILGVAALQSLLTLLAGRLSAGLALPSLGRGPESVGVVHLAPFGRPRRRGVASGWGSVAGCRLALHRYDPRQARHALDLPVPGGLASTSVTDSASRLPHGYSVRRRPGGRGTSGFRLFAHRSDRSSTPRFRAPGSKDSSTGACAWLRRGIQPRSSSHLSWAFSPSRD